MTEENTVKCGRCKEYLIKKKTVFTYLGHTLSHEIPTCPQCGKVFISHELAEGRMSEIEKLLEEK